MNPPNSHRRIDWWQRSDVSSPHPREAENGALFLLHTATHFIPLGCFRLDSPSDRCIMRCTGMRPTLHHRLRGWYAILLSLRLGVRSASPKPFQPRRTRRSLRWGRCSSTRAHCSNNPWPTLFSIRRRSPPCQFPLGRQLRGTGIPPPHRVYPPSGHPFKAAGAGAALALTIIRARDCTSLERRWALCHAV